MISLLICKTREAILKSRIVTIKQALNHEEMGYNVNCIIVNCKLEISISWNKNFIML